MIDELQKKRVVLDTNQILAAGSRWVDPLYHNPNSPAQELVRVVARSHTGLFSPKIMAGYIEKLLEKGHPKKRVTKIIGLLLEVFEQINITTATCSPVPTDLDDIIFLLCAIDGQANFIISNDQHLLVLDQAYPQFRIYNPETAIKELQETQKE